MNPGVLESVAVGQRADVSVAPMGYANGELDTRKYYDIMSKWMTDCIMGKTSADMAIQGAEKELRANGLID
jgi:putative aldouronate transport system substrate-binding protein